MASGGYDNDKDNYFARLWDVETGKELRRFMHGKKGYGIREPGVFSRRENAGHPWHSSRRLLRLFDVDTGKRTAERSRRMAA